MSWAFSVGKVTERESRSLLTPQLWIRQEPVQAGIEGVCQAPRLECH